MAEWYAGIQGRIFTQIQYMLKKKYPDLNCTATNESITPAKFPSLYLHETQEERLQDLTNDSVNAVESTVYIKVWAHKPEINCRNILADATVELKRFGYNIKNLPSTTLNDQLAFGEIMARRVIGANDKDIIGN